MQAPCQLKRKMLPKMNPCGTCLCMLLFSCVLYDRKFTCSSQFSDFSCWRYIPFKLAHRARTQAGVAERYTRLSQKQVPQGLRVRISPPALPVYRCLPPSSTRSTGPSKVYQGLPKSMVVYRVCCQFCCQRRMQSGALQASATVKMCEKTRSERAILPASLRVGFPQKVRPGKRPSFIAALSPHVRCHHANT